MQAMLAALLLVAAMGPWPEAEVECGNVSPVGNSCSAGQILATPQLEGNAVVLGFFGRVTIEVRFTFPEPPLSGVIRWQCDALGSAATATCTGPHLEGRVTYGVLSDVVCIASRHPALPLPPLGPWGCEVMNGP